MAVVQLRTDVCNHFVTAHHVSVLFFETDHFLQDLCSFSVRVCLPHGPFNGSGGAGVQPFQIKLQEQTGDPYTDNNKQLKGVVASFAKSRPTHSHYFTASTLNTHNIKNMDPLLPLHLEPQCELILCCPNTCLCVCVCALLRPVRSELHIPITV